MAETNFSGRDSEWNEASFKSRRLNDIQELINFYKMQLLSKSNGEWNFMGWHKAIDLLYGEGQSKYGDKEKREVLGQLEIARKLIRSKNICVKKTINTISGKKTVFEFNDDVFEKLYSLLYSIEMKVKDYNDKHGLTTKNKEYSGLF